MTEEMWLDQEDPKIIGRCAVCGDEIYEGETIYRIDGDLIHEECLREWAENEYREFREVV